jgi:low temperature requirement protein LtrA
MTATRQGAVRWGLRPRDPGESHRASTPLELLFDLTIVVAVAQAGAELHHSLSAGDVAGGVIRYAMVFFAIWWAWMNFTWFASAYDADDLPYRLLTLVQLGGALLIAAGIPSAFEEGEFLTVTVGYTVMRIALVVQWLRAAAGDPERRPVALAYATGIAVVQVLWILRLILPGREGLLGIATFLVLVAAEILVPVIAERRGSMTTWHPEHVAERYGLFTLIVLGESILAGTVTLQRAATERGVSVDVVVLALAGLMIVFSLWWIYFHEDVAESLRADPKQGFLWGYGHYLVFAGLAAVGAGLQVGAEHLTGAVTTDSAGSQDTGAAGAGLSDLGAGLSVAIPVAVVLTVLALLHNRLSAARGHDSRVPVLFWGGSGVLVLGAGTIAGFSVSLAMAAIAAVCVAVMVLKIVMERSTAGAGIGTP